MNYKDFLQIQPQFSLGGLLTEQSHPHTVGLSELAINNLSQAIQRMKDLDMHVFDVLEQALPQLHNMWLDIQQTFQKGKRVFICGCGSTGRLALTLETLYRQQTKRDNVISFMSGGDVAIIASVEDFEDHPEFGAQQLQELGFEEGDLLISSTEGGETPWVIGATQKASEISKPYFLYCNPDEVLLVERSQQVFKNEKIHKINLSVGQQAITGSTRMQCSTILTYAIGLGLLIENDFLKRASENIHMVREFYVKLDTNSFLSKFIEIESDIYKKNGYLFYRSQPNVAIGILTDTTERSPTFSLYPFEGINDKPINPSWCYYVLDDENEQLTTQEAWHRFFYGRDPRALSTEYWSKYKNKVSLEKLMTHDISPQQFKRRIKYAGGTHYCFRIEQQDQMKWTISQEQIIYSNQIPALNDILGQNIIMKCLLNIHSTLVMGRLGRFMSNIMIYVRPSNFKLIDRAIRYVIYLMKQNSIEEPSYEKVCQILFEEKEKLIYGEAIVLKVYERMLKLLQQ